MQPSIIITRPFARLASSIKGDTLSSLLIFAAIPLFSRYYPSHTPFSDAYYTIKPRVSLRPPRQAVLQGEGRVVSAVKSEILGLTSSLTWEYRPKALPRLGLLGQMGPEHLGEILSSFQRKEREDGRCKDSPSSFALFASKPFATFALNIRHRLFC